MKENLHRISAIARRIPAPVILFVLAVAWLAWLSKPFLFMGRLTYVRDHELGDGVLSQLAYVVTMLRTGHFSFWLPAQGAGTDLLGNFNSPLVDVLLFVLFPGWLAHSLGFLLVTGTAMFGCYILLHRSMESSRWTACLGAALYSSYFLVDFSGHVFAKSMGFAMALAPLLLHQLLRVGQGSGRRWLGSGLLGLGIGVGGHYSWTIFMLVAMFLAALLLEPRRIYRWLPHLAVIGVVVGIVQLPFFIANLATLVFSARDFVSMPTAPESGVNWSKLIADVMNYVELNLRSNEPKGQIPKAAALLVPLALILSWDRSVPWQAVRRLLIMGAFAVILPFLDVLPPHLLAANGLFGYYQDSADGITTGYPGRIGGPAEFRSRYHWALFSSAFSALAVDLFWKVCIQSLRRFGWPRVRIASRMERDVSQLRFGWTRVRIAGEMAITCFRPTYALKFVCLVVVLAAVFYLSHDFVKSQANFHNLAANHMRRLAREGMNFSAFYAHPDLRELAAERLDFSLYRVATVVLEQPGTWPGPWSWYQHEGSLLPGFQVAYGFETADAYMSNLTRRYMDYWALMLTGRPSYRTANYNSSYYRKFKSGGLETPQKLYLFEPLGSSQPDADSCIRTETPINFGAYYNLAMLSLANVAYIVSAIPLADPQLRLLTSPTRDALRRLQCVSPNEHAKAFYSRGLVGRPIYIYRNEAVLPRVFAPAAIEAFADDGDLFDALTSRSAESLAATAVARGADLPAEAVNRSGPPAQIGKVTTIRGDHLSIEVSASTAGPIVIANAFTPYWQASADGMSLPVFPLYHTFIGIWLPPGRHVVDLRYRPPYAKSLP